jgi:hypothetical protein
MAVLVGVVIGRGVNIYFGDPLDEVLWNAGAVQQIRNTSTFPWCLWLMTGDKPTCGYQSKQSDGRPFHRTLCLVGDGKQLPDE